MTPAEKLQKGYQAYKAENKAKKKKLAKAYLKIAELEGILQEILDCPNTMDEATIPKEGIDLENKAHRTQIVSNYSISLDRTYRANNILDKK